MNALPNRDLRQRDIVPPDRLRDCRVTVIGVGAIGRQAAIQLAAIGVPEIDLVDFDVVEDVNLACQGFCPTDLGRPKIDAVADTCRQINPDIRINTQNGRFRRSIDVGNAVFVCVDAIDTRRAIWNAVRDRVRIYIDARMSAEVVRVLTVADETGWTNYPSTLFTPGESFRGACTAKSTIFTASIAAGLMLEQFSRFLRDLPVDLDLLLNLLASELVVSDSRS